jgi:hypothetical protein
MKMETYNVLGSTFETYNDAFVALVEAYFPDGINLDEKGPQAWAQEIEESGWLKDYAEKYGEYRSGAIVEAILEIVDAAQ